MNVARPLLLFIFLLSFAELATAELVRYEGHVVGVADGDTITVLDKDKVRLMGIDAPEKSQAFGNVSRQHLAARVFSKVVTIEYAKLDRYRREIGKVLVSGADANLEQVEAGLAWHYEKYAREQTAKDRAAYSLAEERARSLKAGLWRDAEPIAPWDFRRSRRKRVQHG